MISPVAAGDAAVSLVGLVVLAGIAAAAAFAVHRGCSSLVTCVDVLPAPPPAPSDLGTSLHNDSMHRDNGGLLSSMLSAFTGRQSKWVPRPRLHLLSAKKSVRDGAHPPTRAAESAFLDASVGGAKNFALQFEPLIGRVSGGTLRELYFLFGCLWSTVTGVVGALDPTQSSQCKGAQATLLVVAFLSLASLVVVQPFSLPFDQRLHIVLEGLSVLVAILLLADVGDGAAGISYAQIALSAAVSLLRVATRLSDCMRRDGKEEDDGPQLRRQLPQHNNNSPLLFAPWDHGGLPPDSSGSRSGRLSPQDLTLLSGSHSLTSSSLLHRSHDYEQSFSLRHPRAAVSSISRVGDQQNLSFSHGGPNMLSFASPPPAAVETLEHVVDSRTVHITSIIDGHDHPTGYAELLGLAQTLRHRRQGAAQSSHVGDINAVGIDRIAADLHEAAVKAAIPSTTMDAANEQQRSHHRRHGRFSSCIPRALQEEHLMTIMALAAMDAPSPAQRTNFDH